MALDDLQKAYLRRVIGDFSVARIRLKERRDEAEDTITSAKVPLAASDGRRKVDMVAVLSDYRQTNRAINALTSLESNHEPDGEEGQALTAIILKESRPSLLIQNGTFKAPSINEWAMLKEHQATLEAIFPAVGRIELSAENPLNYFGTGFLVAPDLILTNRHVAQFFIRGDGDLTLRSDLRPQIDYAQEYQVDRSQIAAIKQAKLVDNYWDLAVLQVEWGEQGSPCLPLCLAGSPPPDLKNGLVATVGYPALDRRRSDSISLQMQIFEGVFDKKRIAPGYTLGRADFQSFGHKVKALQHDCSTLGGNSGSCIYSLDSKAVIGLHFAGLYLIANYAVPTWELVNNPTLKAFGLQFV
ncbi:MAG: serine protease [Chloroflexota bacterium]